METQASSSTESSSRRRRRRSRTKTVVSLGRFAWLRSAAVGRGVFWGMSALAAGYAGLIFYFTWVATFAFGPVWLDVDKAEARYRMGPPTAEAEAGAVWTHRENGAFYRTRFAADGLLKSIFCAEYTRENAGCPSTLGLGIDSSEDAMFLRLGAPDREIYDGEDKIVHYDSLGLTMRLRRLLIVGIEKHHRSGPLSYVPDALWMLVP